MRDLVPPLRNPGNDHACRLRPADGAFFVLRRCTEMLMLDVTSSSVISAVLSYTDPSFLQWLFSCRLHPQCVLCVCVPLSMMAPGVSIRCLPDPLLRPSRVHTQTTLQRPRL
jgi:hypothetical protein